ncbi:MAG: hypothetical protein V1718_03440 [archaeon]
MSDATNLQKLFDVTFKDFQTTFNEMTEMGYLKGITSGERYLEKDFEIDIMKRSELYGESESKALLEGKIKEEVDGYLTLFEQYYRQITDSIYKSKSVDKPQIDVIRTGLESNKDLMDVFIDNSQLHQNAVSITSILNSKNIPKAHLWVEMCYEEVKNAVDEIYQKNENLIDKIRNYKTHAEKVWDGIIAEETNGQKSPVSDGS